MVEEFVPPLRVGFRPWATRVRERYKATMGHALEDTGERHLPWSLDFVTGYEHVHRYLLARQYVRGKRVLDISCGEGYGTAMLAQAAQSVVGVDIDSRTVIHARNHHRKPHTHFVRADAQRFALMPGSVDVIVSFETLEHFDAHEAFLTAMKSSLIAGGILLISTPNRSVYSDEAAQRNPFHRRELYRRAFRDLLRKHFKHVQLLGQNLIASSIIAGATGDYFLREDQTCRVLTMEYDAAQLEIPAVVKSKQKPRYYIAVCSDIPLPPPPNTVMVDSAETLYKSFVDYRQEAFALRGECRTAEERFVQSATQLAATGTKLWQAESELAATKPKLWQAETKLWEAESELAATGTKLWQAESELARVRHDQAIEVSTARKRLVRALLSNAPQGGMVNAAHAGLRALIVIPGSLNHFYNQIGHRIATALRNLGFAVDVHTLHAAPARDYDWCLLINLAEILVSYGKSDSGMDRIAHLQTHCHRMAVVLLDCAKTWWFANAYHLCEETKIDLLFDLGFHDQSEYLSPDQRARYHFVFNGLTEPEQRIVREQPPVTKRTIPWVFVGHLTSTRSLLVQRLMRDYNPNGYVYLPHLAPFTEDGPHMNEQQILTLLHHAEYQIWCAHHDYFYLESERFRNSVLTGGVPIKILLHSPDTTQSLPFSYLLLDESSFDVQLRGLDFATTRQRVADDFCALPSLEESLLATLSITAGRGATRIGAGNGR